MSCFNCDEGFVVRCVDDVCRGIGECCLGRLDCDGIAVCPVCKGDPDLFDDTDDEFGPEFQEVRG